MPEIYSQSRRLLMALVCFRGKRADEGQFPVSKAVSPHARYTFAFRGSLTMVRPLEFLVASRAIATWATARDRTAVRRPYIFLPGIY